MNWAVTMWPAYRACLQVVENIIQRALGPQIPRALTAMQKAAEYGKYTRGRPIKGLMRNYIVAVQGGLSNSIFNALIAAAAVVLRHAWRVVDVGAMDGRRGNSCRYQANKAGGGRLTDAGV